jgi:hypothetical protein
MLPASGSEAQPKHDGKRIVDRLKLLAAATTEASRD